MLSIKYYQLYVINKILSIIQGGFYIWFPPYMGIQSITRCDIALKEIGVDQQTRARDRTFDGVPDSGCPPVPAGQPRPHLVNLWPNFVKLP